MVTGGVHGASRLGGHGLADGIVFGPIAGKEAANRATQIEMPEVSWDDVAFEREQINKILDKKPRPLDADEAKMKLKTLMWNNAGILRDGEKLLKGQEELEEMEDEDLPRLVAQDPRSLKYAFEIMKMVSVATMVVKAATMRTESRGPHYRLDYPYRDDKNWLKNIFINKIGDQMVLKTRPVVYSFETPDYDVPDDFGLEIKR